MHFEFSNFLSKSFLEKVPGPVAGSEKGLSLLKDILVEDPPRRVEADLSCDLAFKLAAALNISAGLGERYNCLEIAEALLSSLPSSAFFQISKSDLGHLNAVATDSFKADFFNQLFSAGAEVLFSKESFSEFKTEGNSDWFRFVLSEQELEKKVKRSNNQQLVDFYQNIQGGDYSSNDYLMVLVALADPEIDLVPYASGVNSRENVPWFLKKFFIDLKDFTKKLEKQIKDQTFCYDEDLFKVLPRPLVEVSEMLLYFRASLFFSFRTKKPELWLGYILQLMKSFYRCYNRPQVRMLSGEYSRSEVCCFLLELSKILSCGLSKGLKVIENSPCEGDKSVTE